MCPPIRRAEADHDIGVRVLELREEAGLVEHVAVLEVREVDLAATHVRDPDQPRLGARMAEPSVGTDAAPRLAERTGEATGQGPRAPHRMWNR